jgi:ABC-type sugar transport system ATPase subunit
MSESPQESFSAQTRTPILELRKLEKRFGATHALKAVCPIA